MVVNIGDRQDDTKKLADCLLIFYPDDFVVTLIKSTKDLYEYRFTLRGIQYTTTSFRHLLYIVTNAVEHNLRFRTYACIKLLRDILRKNTDIELEGDITNKLFYLFQHFVFSTNGEVQRHANNLIRNRLLADEHIDWLIEHYKQSSHIVNRLLRYPQQNMQIAAWARGIYERNELPERRAEILSILITDDLSAIHPEEERNTVLWAIYYSKSTTKVKKGLLLSVINQDNLHQCVDSIIAIAIRLGCGSLIKDLVKKYS